MTNTNLIKIFRKFNEFCKYFDDSAVSVPSVAV